MWVFFYVAGGVRASSVPPAPPHLPTSLSCGTSELFFSSSGPIGATRDGSPRTRTVLSAPRAFVGALPIPLSLACHAVPRFERAAHPPEQLPRLREAVALADAPRSLAAPFGRGAPASTCPTVASTSRTARNRGHPGRRRRHHLLAAGEGKKAICLLLLPPALLKDSRPSGVPDGAAGPAFEAAAVRPNHNGQPGRALLSYRHARGAVHGRHPAGATALHQLNCTRALTHAA